MDEVEEVVENLMHNEIDYLDLSFDFVHQAPFTSLLYHRRLPDFSDAEFVTLLQVLMQALERNVSVQQVHLDWAFLRLLQPVEQEALLRHIGHLAHLRTISITGSTAHTQQQQISVFSLLRLLEGLQQQRRRRLESLTMDAMGSLKLQDWLYVQHLSQHLQATGAHLRVLRLENLVLPQQPNFLHALEPLVETLAQSCPVLQQVCIAISLPHQYRRVPKPLCTVAALSGLHRLRVIRLHNWGLHQEHVQALLQLAHLRTLDVWNNYPFTSILSSSTTGTTRTGPTDHPSSSATTNTTAATVTRPPPYYLQLLMNRQQMTLQELRGIHDDTCEGHNATRDLYLLLNRCGRAAAAAAITKHNLLGAAWVDYVHAIATTTELPDQIPPSVRRREEEEEGGGGGGVIRYTRLDALYTAIREQPFP